MKQVYQIGDIKKYSFKVTERDVAQFKQQSVHQVCATFTLAREIEWCTRLFVIDMLELHEEGIGTRLHIEHQSPALLGQEVLIKGEIQSIVKNEIVCSFLATVNDRVIAQGETGQKILPKDKIQAIFNQLK